MEQDKPDIPDAPQFQQDPNAAFNTDRLTQLGQGLTSGQFTNPDSSLGFLAPSVTPNNELSLAQAGLATRETERVANRFRQDTLNQLEANNQLTSSVAVNRLSDLNEEFSRDIADINTRFFIADLERSFANTQALFGAGLQTTQAGASAGLQNQNQLNSFNLANFDNQVESAQANASSGRGGLFGGLFGTAIGAFGGPAGAAIGGTLGAGLGEAVSPSSTGSVATSFGAGALSLLGQQAASQQPQFSIGTGLGRFTGNTGFEDPNRLIGADLSRFTF